MFEFLLSAALALSPGETSAQPSNQLPKTSFQQVEQSKNASQLLRSNSSHFWRLSRDPKTLKDLASYVQEHGIISGDPHLGNFSVIPVKNKNGVTKLKYLNIDFDDGGRGPFALEFAAFVAIAKASSDQIQIRDLFKAYLSGLHGEKMPLPKPIKKAEDFPLEEYESLRTAYVKKRVSGDRFKYKEGEIEVWDGSPSRQSIASALRDHTILDVAKRPVERGGSKDSLRLWLLARDPSGDLRILELKEYQEPSLAQYRPQAKADQRVRELFTHYWKDNDPSSYSLVRISGQTYWLREKKVEVLEFKNKSQEDEARLYLANLMGRQHLRQAKGPKYLEQIDTDPERFKEAVKVFVRGYLGLASAALM